MRKRHASQYANFGSLLTNVNMDLTSITMNLAIVKRDLKYQSLSFALSVFLRRLIERCFETMAEITQRIKTDLIGNLCNLHFWIFL